MTTKVVVLVVLGIFFIISSSSSSSSSSRLLATAEKYYNVVDYGAEADHEETDASKAFLAAWAGACASSEPATVYVPSGRFFLARKVVFQGPCNNHHIALRIDVGGSLVAPSDYRAIGDAGNWISFDHVNGLTVSGGTLDAQGAALWSCKTASGSGACPKGATLLSFSNSENIEIGEMTMTNSQLYHMVIVGCKDVRAEGVTISSSGNSPNTDGIHVQASTSVQIYNSMIGTGDDCISIGPGTANLRIESVACGPGHGISIGSLGKSLAEPGVENVMVKRVMLTGTQNGLRIKTWGRPSKGFATNILFQNILMVNVQNPIVIDQNYCPFKKDCPGQESGVRVSDVTYRDIIGTSATQVAVKFDCSKANPCTGIRLENVQLTYNNFQPADASCNNAEGTTSGFVLPSSCL